MTAVFTVVGVTHIQQETFQGLEELVGLVRNADLTGVQLRPGVPGGRFLCASADGVEFTAVHYEGDVRTRGVYTSRVSLGVRTFQRGQVTQWGETALPGDVFVMPGGGEHEDLVAGQVSYAVLSFDVSALVELGCGEAWEGDRGIWERPHKYRAPAHVRDGICRSIRQFTHLLAGHMGAMSERRLESFQKDLAETFLSGIVFATDEPEAPGKYRSARLVRAVEDWVAAMAPEPVRIADVCRQLGVSRRSLERAFHETLNMGPAQYLITKRLSEAHLALATADPRAVSVTDVAIDHGFWELGRFAARYVQMFGEKPSETLHRSMNTRLDSQEDLGLANCA